MCLDHSEVSQDWQNTYKVPLYKGNMDKGKHLHYRGTSLLGVPAKLFERDG